MLNSLQPVLSGAIGGHCGRREGSGRHSEGHGDSCRKWVSGGGELAMSSRARLSLLVRRNLQFCFFTIHLCPWAHTLPSKQSSWLFCVCWATPRRAVYRTASSRLFVRDLVELSLGLWTKTWHTLFQFRLKCHWSPALYRLGDKVITLPSKGSSSRHQIWVLKDFLLRLVEAPQPTDKNLGHAHCLAVQALTLGLW